MSNSEDSGNFSVRMLGSKSDWSDWLIWATTVTGTELWFGLEFDHN